MKGRLSRVAAWLLPAAAWALLPKCPMCLAVWLTAVTGISFSVGGSARLRDAVWALCFAAVVNLAWRGGIVSAILRRIVVWRTAPHTSRQFDHIE